jgi:spoIIIJ-associated protein
VARQVEMSGPTVSEAVGRALLKLGLERDAVDVEVVAEPRKGIFGSKPAVVLVREKDASGAPSAESAAPVTAPPPSPPTEQQSSARPSEEPLVTDTDTVATENAQPEEELTPEERLNQLDEEADMAADFVEGLLDRLDLPGDIEIEITEEQALLNLEDVGSGLLIGRRGATLDALQELVRCAVQRQTERRSRVRVDVEGYRARHVEKLRDRCREAIAQVRESGQPVRLEPMDAYERKLMHDLVSKTGGVTSSSEGTEPKRRVVIHPEA